MPSNSIDEYPLERIAEDNEIGAGILLPFTINRLQEAERTELETLLLVHLRDIEEAGERRRSLRLKWFEESVHRGPMPVQEDVITELAACGVACALVPMYSRMLVIQVAQEGDRFDYWVGDGEEEYALEVSGTVGGDLEHRHSAKVRQLRDNPYQVDGFVAVTRFVSRESVFSFNYFGEGN